MMWHGYFRPVWLTQALQYDNVENHTHGASPAAAEAVPQMSALVTPCFQETHKGLEVFFR